MSAPDPAADRPGKRRRGGRGGNPESTFRFALDTCSKKKDVAGAIALYDAAVAAGDLHLGAYHYNALLYLCSASPSPAAAEKGFEIFHRMLAAGVVPSEATLTAAARLAVAKDDGELAFRLASEMAVKYDVLPKLRTYGPALLWFCEKGEVDKALAVEEDMVGRGVELEEVEIAALLKVCGAGGLGDKVYYFMQKLRRAVKVVKEETAVVVDSWFRSAAAVAGKLDWDVEEVRELVRVKGGGWHGIGWIGKGEWDVCRTRVGVDGLCLSCEMALASVDIDVEETEKFARSVAVLALQRGAGAKFGEFQEWLEKLGDNEYIVDGANLGYFHRNFSGGGFDFFQIDFVVKELRKKNPMKWPLVVLSSQRVQSLMENLSTRKTLEEWKAHNALYATPKGSNDDWYWIYAAVKNKAFILTNDEMRDHIFELLGQNFFLKWKERHQVHYCFDKGDLKLQMPSTYSSVIQEADSGSWHVPMYTECSDEASRPWLCIKRKEAKSRNKMEQKDCS